VDRVTHYPNVETDSRSSCHFAANYRLKKLI